ncbi:adenine-specific methyltransferase EcoRI family protein [Fibrobacter sp. UWR2]|uniref:adenine-specific methyltransferase EcoRI family protein n=1 Tax=Fibrobacter sp. UWR2 TaxID=1964352 RepID=UPI000B523297|nr:adenine-specific methyltransferase EcoRI family protein [Fibrobacter sp. UWR2]OWV00294.1 DNA methyltransferase [Fibrobacter sp. UWR2]
MRKENPIKSRAPAAFTDLFLFSLLPLWHNENVFRGKTVLLPCDDPEWSNFTRYFAQNFEKLGLKKLISTSYAIESKKYKIKDWQPTLFEQQAPWFDVDKSKIRGKIFTLDHDTNKNGRIDIHDLEWQYLEGDGDFRSDEIMRLRDEADFIITNPPFSLFREFVAWIMESKKRFTVIGNMNAITYKEIFPLLKENETWLGATIHSGDREFGVPKEYPLEAAGWRIDEKGNHFIRVKGVRWFTNIEHGRRHEPLSLMTEADNIKFSRHKEVKGVGYKQYDNYDAIEVPYTDAIPSDYKGVMGVPISFLDKYCPEQFEILGITKTWFGGANKVYPEQIQVDKHGKRSRVTKLNDGATIELSEIPDGDTYYIVNDKMYQQVYARVLIRQKGDSRSSRE